MGGAPPRNKKVAGGGGGTDPPKMKGKGQMTPPSPQGASLTTYIFLWGHPIYINIYIYIYIIHIYIIYGGRPRP